MFRFNFESVMKYHTVFQKRYCISFRPLYQKNISRRIHTVHRRKSIEMKPWLRFANSTAGSVEQRSKWPKMTEHFKTTARWKDLVSICWRLVHEKKVTAIGTQNNSVIEKKNSTRDNTDPAAFAIKTQPIVKSETSDDVILQPVSQQIANTSSSDTSMFKTSDKVETASTAHSENQIIEGKNNALKLITRHLPGYVFGISLSLRKKDGLLKMVTLTEKKEKEEKLNLSQSVATEKVEESVSVHEEKITSSISKTRFRPSTLKESSDSRTRYLMHAVATSSSLASRSMRLQEFCNHLSENPTAKNLAVKERAIPLMLRLRIITPEPSIQALINETLALLGYIHPLPRHGIRILSIDGGGTRGIMAIEILRALERITQQPIHHLFDFMCGVSTGSILSILLGALKVSMNECEELYKSTSTEIFNQSTLWGTGKLVLNHAFYDTEGWVKVLRKNLGDTPLIQTSRDPTSPKIAAISTVVNQPRLQNFIFRNYDYPYRDQSHFLGSYTAELWEAVRASAAAPGYFEECKLGKYVHQDGGVLTNNPTAIAIHECRHLWPGEEIQCVVSIGNGRYEPRVPMSPTNYSSLKTKIMRIVDSATDTEMVHTILGDLLPPSRYFRINPYLTESISLDEVRPEKFKQLQDDANMYIRKNEAKIKQAARVLLEPKGQFQKLRDSVKLKFMTYL